MAIYDNLPVFKATYDLLLAFIRLSHNLHRDFRYTIGEDLKKEIFALCVCIYRANIAHEKAPFISEAREKMVTMKLHIRILHDTKQITIKQYALQMDQMESISKQLTAWNKYINNREKQEDLK